MQQQDLRRWARDNVNATKPTTLSAEETRALAAGIAKALSALDGFWEGIAGRKLTEEEKFGKPIDA